MRVCWEGGLRGGWVGRGGVEGVGCEGGLRGWIG